MKFRLALEEYDFDIQYIKGNENVVADALSRISISDLIKGKEEDSVVYAVTRSMTKDVIEVKNDGNRTEVPPRAVQLIKPPKGACWMLIEHNPNYPCGVIISPNSKTVRINWSHVQSDIDSIVSKTNNILEVEKIQEIVLIKNKLSINFISIFKCTFKNSTVRFVVTNDKTIIEDSRQKRVILNDYHHLPSGGHMGINRMLKNIQRKYSWPGLYDDIEKYVKNCLECKKCKMQKHTRAPMQMTSTADEAFEKIYLDIVGPLPVTDNNKRYILTIQCELSKFIEAYTLENKEAETVSEVFVREFVLRFGVPRKIATDQGTEFTAAVFENTCKLLGIDKILATAYHPESIGALENSHKHLNNFLKIKSLETKRDWSQWVPFWVFSHNNAVHSATGYAPAELVFGKFSNLPSNLTSNVIDPIYNFDSYISELRYRLQVAWKDAKDTLIENKKKSKVRYDNK